MNLPPVIFISSNAVSGDLQGARLAQELRKIRGDLCLIGSGGEQMISAGVDVRVQTVHLASVGFLASSRFYLDLRKAVKEQKRAVLDQRPDLAILIDSEGYFNECFGDFLIKEGIPVIHYFPPLVWLWGAWRAGKIAQKSHAIIPAFPNEMAIFEKVGASTFYFGHPLVDIVGESSKAVSPANSGHKNIGLMPGSRFHEVEMLGRPMIEAARSLRQQFPGAKFIIPVAGPHLRKLLETEVVRAGMQEWISLVSHASYDSLRSCDLVIVAAGTATMELTLLHVPMLVVYRLGTITYQAVRCLVKTPFIAMPNIVADRLIVPELRQNEVRAERIMAEAVRILSDASVVAKMREDLQEVASRMGKPGVLKRIAEFVLDELEAIRKVKRVADLHVSVRMTPRPSGSLLQRWTQKINVLMGWLLVPVDYVLWQTVEYITSKYYHADFPRQRIALIGRFTCNASRFKALKRMKLVLEDRVRDGDSGDSLWESYVEEVGIGTMEPIFLARSASRMRRMISLDGENLLQEALAQKKGVTFLLSHLGPMGSVPSALGSRGYDITITGTPLHRPYYEKKLRDMLARVPASRAVIGDNLPFRAGEAFRRNGIFCTYVDYSVGVRHNAWLPFGKAEVMANLAGAIIALRYRTPVFYVRCERLAKDNFHVQLIPLAPDFDGPVTLRDRATQLLRQATDLLSVDVLQRPEQWWPWFIADIRAKQVSVENVSFHPSPTLKNAAQT